MARRMFYVPELQGSRAFLRGETAQHLRKVLRAERGQRYEVSDGTALYLAEVVDFGKDLVELALIEPLEAPVSPVSLRLCPALIKFDHFEWILEKATELGVERVSPVYALRSEKGLDQAAGKRMDRWLRILREAGQQSRRLTPPELDEPVRLDELMQDVEGIRLFLDEERGAPPLLGVLPEQRRTGDRVVLLCGPEGGWDPRERSQILASGWAAVSLGPQILRAETAALSALSVVNAAWWESRPKNN